MATFHLEDGCTLVSEHDPSCVGDSDHAFNERRWFDEARGVDTLLYDLCSKCGARLYPPGGFKAPEPSASNPKAFEEGIDDYVKDVPVDDNPYPIEDAGAFNGWRAGWEAAKNDEVGSDG